MRMLNLVTGWIVSPLITLVVLMPKGGDLLADDEELTNPCTTGQPCCCRPGHAQTGGGPTCSDVCKTSPDCGLAIGYGWASGECELGSAGQKCAMKHAPVYRNVTQYTCIWTPDGCPPGQAKCYWRDDGLVYLPFPECSGTGGNCQ